MGSAKPGSGVPRFFCARLGWSGVQGGMACAGCFLGLIRHYGSR
jgi:hypothetical protein